MHILRCMGSKFCVKFQRCPLKFHTKIWTHTPQNMHFTVSCFCVWVTISLNCDVISLSETGPRSTYPYSSHTVIQLQNESTAQFEYRVPVEETHMKVRYLKHFQWNSPRVNSTAPHWWLVNIVSNNGSVPLSNKPLSVPMMAQFYVGIWHHWATMS